MLTAQYIYSAEEALEIASDLGLAIGVFQVMLRS